MKALFVIDVQKEYMTRYDPDLLARINERISLALERGELVVYVKNVRRLRNGKTAYEFAEGLNVCSPNIVYKEKASVFQDEALPRLLEQNGVDQVEIIGIDGCCCVASAAIDARKAGYEVILPCTCIGVQNQERFAKKSATMSKLGVKIIVK